MLIKVFGIWLMTANIQYMSPDILTSSKDDFSQRQCIIKYIRESVIIYDHTCDEVAAEINSQTAGE